MNTQTTQHSNHRQRAGLVGAIVATVAASLCCVVPLVLVALGASGAWIGSLKAFEPARPYFIALTLGFLSFAFYREYRRPAAEQCAPGTVCANPRASRVNRVVLWIATVLILGLLAFPYVAARLTSAPSAVAPTSQSTVTLAVKGMTCGSCPLTVRGRLQKVPGVLHAEVTLEPPQAVVTYDPTKTSVDSLVGATAEVGYRSTAITSEQERTR